MVKTQRDRFSFPVAGWLKTTPVQLLTLLSLTSSMWLTGAQSQASAAVSVGSSVTFRCGDSEATIQAKRGPVVALGMSKIYIGYQQVSATNKNPILIRFNAGRQAWCRTNYETTGDDNTGYGLLWNGGDVYAVFSATGAQGTASQDFRRFATKGWLTSYGNGGGPKVAIIARIDPANGNVRVATYLSAILSSGRTNSLQVNNLSLLPTGNLQVTASSWFNPRRINRSRMTCTGSSPFPYTIEFSPNLNTAIRATATGCS